MRSVDELMAELLDGERRTEELCVALLDGMQGEESSDDEDEDEEMWILRELYEKVCAMDARLCVVAARLEEVAAAEFQQQLVEGLRERCHCGIESLRIEIVDVTAAAAADAGAFQREVIAEMTAATVVWWSDCAEKVVMRKDVVWSGDWMREWEAMVRWCGGGWLRRLLLVE